MAEKPSEVKKLKRTKKAKTDKKNNENYGILKHVPNKEDKSLQVVNIIPLLEETFSISKKTLTENIRIEKKWVSTTKKIEVPVSVEEVYINGKEMKTYDKDDDVLSELNKRIVQSFEEMDDNQRNQYSILEQHESKRELVPLLDNANNKNRSDNVKSKETKKVIPILGEEVVVSKRIVKLGELIITRNKITKNKKIAVDIKKEQATIKYPDGSTKML
jgi:stress response protein YsnF